MANLIKDSVKPVASLFAGAALILSPVMIAPAVAHDGGSVVINGLDFGDDGDLLERLIDMDASDLEELRAEFAEAREEIAEAIVEVDEARTEASDIPGGGAIVAIALKMASSVVDRTVGEVLSEVRAELSAASIELDERRDDLGEEEYAETGGAIAMILSELDSIEIAIGELTQALRA